MHEEIDPQYEQKRRDLSRKGKYALFIGGGVAFLGGVTFASFALMALFGHSLFHVRAEAQGFMTLGFAAFLYFLGIVMMVAGGLVALGGIIVLLFANTGWMMKFQAAGTVPVARAVVRQVNAMQEEMKQDPERRGP
ncbi:hypothetical protein [Polyangium sp. y55x31]|uniref:hypothetical protein n=1 Tax=Polyangium sp. y55x31 TaxID=3042688 RepID=UPI0024829B3D|nr:hypothetical protein [Polyangium sp. y55x31]MDI1477273.1 hypothetical protein [Polyangium sp. y55x31]